MSKIKILIVEDEAIVAEDIASQLENMGYVVIDIVDSGEEAIASATTNQPDLVLMDIMLAGEIDGTEAAGQISNKLKIPVVYLTAYADEDTLNRAKVTNPFGYILKPFEQKALRANIEIALSRHQSELKMQKHSVREPTVGEDKGGLSESSLRRAIRYINENLDRELSLADMGTLVNMSSNHFARLFKQSMGVPPYQYLTNCRIERAKVLLAQQDLPIGEICHCVGFRNQSHFTSVFGKHTGVTPKAYRNNI